MDLHIHEPQKSSYIEPTAWPIELVSLWSELKDKGQHPKVDKI